VDIQRLLAPNPGLFTGPGTNTYVLRSGRAVLVVDPGPAGHPSHHTSILETVEGSDAQGILVTHSHPDHAPLANPLGDELGVPVYGYEPGPQFDPDVLVDDGHRIPVGRHELRVLYTPGHSSDHICFLADDVLFTGDHIMGGSTVVVEDMVAYLASLRRLEGITLRRLYPGHGPVMDDPGVVIDEYISHRLEREEQIVAALEDGAGTVGAVVQEVYSDVDPALHPLAAHSVAAHLNKLVADGRVSFAEKSDELWGAFVALIGAPDD
jgi:glyoxylase-like metal-dependent hydrolase (beta-lactamase superfamily II)